MISRILISVSLFVIVVTAGILLDRYHKDDFRTSTKIEFYNGKYSVDTYIWRGKKIVATHYSWEHDPRYVPLEQLPELTDHHKRWAEATVRELKTAFKIIENE